MTGYRAAQPGQLDGARHRAGGTASQRVTLRAGTIHTLVVLEAAHPAS